MLLGVNNEFVPRFIIDNDTLHVNKGKALYETTILDSVGKFKKTGIYQSTYYNDDVYYELPFEFEYQVIKK